MNNNLKYIYEEIKKAKNVLILTHLNPDGDAIGSMLSLKLIIESLNIKVDALITNRLEFMKYLPKSEELLLETNKDYDLTIMVDLNAKNRLGSLEYLYDKSHKLIVLDHHNVEITDDITHYIDISASSATMVIYQFMKENNIPLTPDIAYYLYLGLLTDTGGFAHSNTTSRAFDMASELLTYDLNHNEMYYNFVKPNYDMNYLMLKKEVINNFQIIDNQIAVSFLTYDIIQKHPFDSPKIFVELGRHLKGIEVSVIFIEEEPDLYKVSLRSNNYLDVSAISKKFDGGGHSKASGIRFEGNYEKNKRNIINEIKKELK